MHAGLEVLAVALVTHSCMVGEEREWEEGREREEGREMEEGREREEGREEKRERESLLKLVAAIVGSVLRLDSLCDSVSFIQT